MAAPLNPNSRAGTLRAVLAGKYPAWADTTEVLSTHLSKVKDLTITASDVSTALGQLEKRGMVESMTFNGARLKSWRLTAAGLAVAQSALPPTTPQAVPAPAEKAVDPPRAAAAEMPPAIDLGPVVDRVIDQIVGAFRDALEKRLSVELEQVLATQASAALEKLPGALFREPAAPLKQVTIVGLLDKQASMLHHEYRKEFKLQFVTADHCSGPRLKGLAANSDAVIVMTDFVRHAADEIVESVGGNLIRCPGGMTHLREKLDALYLEEAA